MTEKKDNLILRIGDYITLRHSKPNDGWLCSEGILGDECYTTKQTESNFDDCLWEIHIQYQYSAIREYEEAFLQFCAQVPVDEEEIDEISVDYLNQLQKAAINEKHLNDKLMKTKIGKPVLFGDHIQLRHVKSGKFITVNSQKLAKVERENMRVTIETRGNSLSCLGFVPKFKYDHEGQQMYNGGEIFLRVHERPGEYVHTAKKTGNKSQVDYNLRSEVNCSLEPSCWTVTIYQQAKDYGSGSILAGMLISLQDPDSSGCLTIDEQQAGLTKTAKVVMSPQFQLSSRASSDSYVGTNLLWQIEKEIITQGGNIFLDRDRVSLRDLNSGLFMKVEEDGSLVVAKSRKEASLFDLTNSQTSNAIWLQETSTFHIRLYDRWVGQIKSANNIYMCQLVEDRSAAITFVASAMLQRTVGSELFVGVQATVCLRRFESVSNQALHMRSPATMLAVATNLKTVSLLLQNISTFVANQAINSSIDSKENIGSDQAFAAKIDQMIDGDERAADLVNLFEPLSREMIERRQVMMREQGLLDVLLSLLEMTRTNIFDHVKYTTHRPSNVSTLQHAYSHGMMGHTPHGHASHPKPSFSKPALSSTPSRQRIIGNKLEGNLALQEKLKSTRHLLKSDKSVKNIFGGGGHHSPASGGMLGLFKGLVSPTSTGSHPFHAIEDRSPNSEEEEEEEEDSKVLKEEDEEEDDDEDDDESDKNDDELEEDEGDDEDEDEEDEEEANNKIASTNILRSSFAFSLSSKVSSTPTKPPLSSTPESRSQKSNPKSLLRSSASSSLDHSSSGSKLTRGRTERSPSIFQAVEKSFVRRGSALVTFLRGDQKKEEKTSSHRSSFHATMANMNQTRKESFAVKKDYSSLKRNSTSQELAIHCLKILFLLIKNNHTNQSYVADKFSLLLHHVKEKRIAVLVVEEILRDNLHILQTKIRKKEISIFINLLQEDELNVTFLKLIKNTCSCPKGVDSTQRIVVGALFGDGIPEDDDDSITVSDSNDEVDGVFRPSSISFPSRRKSISTKLDPHDLMLRVFPDSSQLVQTSWSDVHIYAPDAEKTEIKGYRNLVDRGLPAIYVTWEIRGNRGQFSPETLFGSSQVLLSEIMKIEETSMPKSQSNKETAMHFHQQLQGPEQNKRLKGPRLSDMGSSNTHLRSNSTTKKLKSLYIKNRPLESNASSTDMKKRLAEYLATQLYLVADLCLDRNYIAIGLLENNYSYDTLVSILKTESIHNRFKAPVCKILRCLYVDREPQETIAYPRLVRLWDDKEDHNQISYSSFALLQHAISQYIYNLNSKNCDELTAEMTDLLTCLVKFGFYNEPSQIFHITEPLIAILDNYRSEVSTTFHELNSSSNDDATSTTTGIAPFSSISDKYLTHLNTFKDSSNSFLQNSIDRLKIWFSTKWHWEASYLQFTESILGLCFVLSVVVVAVVLSLLQTFRPIQSYSVSFSRMDLFVTVFFITELSARIYCYVVVYKKFFGFFRNIFNFMDMSLVILDLSMIGIGSSSGIANAGRLAKTFRVIRLLRLLRIVRAARILKNLADAASQTNHWVQPQRYSSVTEYESKTLVNILRILSMICDRMMDFSLTIVVKSYIQWSEEFKKNPEVQPLDVYKRFLLQNQDSSADFFDRLGSILLDIIMYPDSNMVQEALHLLMICESRTEFLEETSKQIQIIHSPSLETAYRTSFSVLRDLKSMADMFELWSELESETDLQTARAMFDRLNQLSSLLIMKNEDRTLNVKLKYLVNSDIQTLLRNLGAMNIFMTVLEELYQGGSEELKPQVLEILKACCNLICWFVKCNEENQKIAFEEIDWFVGAVDDDFNTSQVTREILLGNRDLIKQCSRRYIGDFANKILKNGTKPEYLDLFVGMVSMSFEMDSRVQPVEAEIAKYLTGREWSDHLLKWCVGPSHKDYETRINAMKEYVSIETNDDTDFSVYASTFYREENLPSDLRYHMNLLTLLAGCNLGPKLQALYPIDDIIYAILDPRTIDPVRKSLGQVFLECLVVDQDLLSYSEYAWKFVDNMIDTLESEHSFFLIRKGSWFEISLSITYSMFSRFDITQLGQQLDFEDENDESNIRLTRRTHEDVMKIIRRLHAASQDLSSHITLLGPKLVELLKNLVQVLVIQLEDEPSGMEDFMMEQHNRNNLMRVDGGSVKRRKETQDKICHRDQKQYEHKEEFEFFVDSLGLTSADAKPLKGTPNTLSDRILHLIEINSEKLRKFNLIELIFPMDEKKKSKLEVIEQRQKKRAINRALILLSKIPSIHVPNIHSDIRFEPLIRKLTGHVRSKLKRTKTLRSLSAQSAETTLWLLSTLREFLEMKMEVCIDFESEINTDEYGELAQAENFRLIFNDWGVTYLCMDLISIGIQSEITIEAIKLLMVLLIKQGGSPQVQHTIYLYLKETDSVLFFEFIKEAIDGILLWIQRELELRSSISEKSFPVLILFPFIQLMCEGNFLPIKNILREQNGNTRIVDINESLIQFLEFLSKSEHLLCTHICSKVLRTVQKLVQGPCRRNQELFVLNSELLICLNRLIRRTSLSFTEEWEEVLETLKDRIVKLLLSATEGHTKSSVVFERVASTVEFNVLNLVLLPSESENLSLITASSVAALDMDLTASLFEFDITPLQSSYLVLLQSLGYSSLHVSLPTIAKDKMQKELACIEAVWNEEVHVFHFKIPDIVSEISQSVKDSLTEDIDCESQEMKLKDFVKRAKRIFDEAQHQRKLRSFGMNNFGKSKSILSWAMFTNAIIMNLLLMVYLTTQEVSFPSSSSPVHHDDHYSSSSSHTDDHNSYPTYAPTYSSHHRSLSSSSSSVLSHLATYGVSQVSRLLSATAPTSASSEPISDMVYINKSVDQVISVLVIIQIALSAITLFVFILGRMPVLYSSYLEDGKSRVLSLLMTCSDFTFVWYVSYFVIALIALKFERILVTVMLLEWVSLSPVTRDVLLSVQYPARQLLGTLILILIVINIYAGVVFYMYREDVVTFDIKNMWESFKMTVSYGIRGEFGISHEMVDTLGSRLILDISFFVVIVAVLRHILFAIIVDTFGELRELKFERDMQANNMCFICGIDRHDFDRMVLSGLHHGMGFSHHRQTIHNVFNYLSFIFHVWCHEKSEDSGVEMYVRKCLSVGDISWFPVGISSFESGGGLGSGTWTVDATDSAHRENVKAHSPGGGSASGGRGGSSGGGDGHDGPGDAPTSIKSLNISAMESSPNYPSNESNAELLGEVAMIQSQLHRLTVSQSRSPIDGDPAPPPLKKQPSKKIRTSSSDSTSSTSSPVSSPDSSDRNRLDSTEFLSISDQVTVRKPSFLQLDAPYSSEPTASDSASSNPNQSWALVPSPRTSPTSVQTQELLASLPPLEQALATLSEALMKVTNRLEFLEDREQTREKEKEMERERIRELIRNGGDSSGEVVVGMEVGVGGRLRNQLSQPLVSRSCDVPLSSLKPPFHPTSLPLQSELSIQISDLESISSSRTSSEYTATAPSSYSQDGFSQSTPSSLPSLAPFTPLRGGGGDFDSEDDTTPFVLASPAPKSATKARRPLSHASDLSSDRLPNGRSPKPLPRSSASPIKLRPSPLPRTIEQEDNIDPPINPSPFIPEMLVLCTPSPAVSVSSESSANELFLSSPNIDRATSPQSQLNEKECANDLEMTSSEKSRQFPPSLSGSIVLSDQSSLEGDSGSSPPNLLLDVDSLTDQSASLPPSDRSSQSLAENNSPRLFPSSSPKNSNLRYDSTSPSIPFEDEMNIVIELEPSLPSTSTGPQILPFNQSPSPKAELDSPSPTNQLSSLLPTFSRPQLSPSPRLDPSSSSFEVSSPSSAKMVRFDPSSVSPSPSLLLGQVNGPNLASLPTQPSPSPSPSPSPLKDDLDSLSTLVKATSSPLSTIRPKSAFPTSSHATSSSLSRRPFSASPSSPNISPSRPLPGPPMGLLLPEGEGVSGRGSRPQSSPQKRVFRLDRRESDKQKERERERGERSSRERGEREKKRAGGPEDPSDNRVTS